ncbi:O-fucosyltransferase 20-like [Papaver somniferum]|uniref:O-fucosyltransferase 20-like n=1 Tax=Papaver somniferum TaxID=3469 RepID=UPI000E6F7B90|nr:O-fucosyltransferase 20-like [Papaver somniferum]
MKNHNSNKVSYILVADKISILFKPLQKLTNSSMILNMLFRVRPQKSGYFLLFLEICTSFSVFMISYPIVSCISDHKHPLIHINRIFNQRDTFINLSTTTEELWKQPDGLGYRPCLNFSQNYASSNISSGIKNRFLMVVVSGGLNQQKNQIIDDAVIARILQATLIVPIFHVNAVWGDESEFSDIFDERNFKETLKEDVHILSSLPSTYISKRPVRAPIPSNVSEDMVRTLLTKELNKHTVLLLRRFDSKLSKILGPDLQKLRCKVAFHALKFKPWIENFGKKLAMRMSGGHPYMTLHFRLEKDVWVRTGCLPGLGKDADQMVISERMSHPELLTGRSNNITFRERYMAGLCPLDAAETTRLLKAFGASSNTRIYWAGGTPIGGEKALAPIRKQFPHFTNKWALADGDELQHFRNKSSILIALDYIVCINSDVFMANHGGDMARTIQGHRAYFGHKKYITPNKKKLVRLFMNNNNQMNEKEIDDRIKKMHIDSMGSPVLIKTSKSHMDVTAYPAPACMCSSSITQTSI